MEFRGTVAEWEMIEWWDSGDPPDIRIRFPTQDTPGCFVEIQKICDVCAEELSVEEARGSIEEEGATVFLNRYAARELRDALTIQLERLYDEEDWE